MKVTVIAGGIIIAVGFFVLVFFNLPQSTMEQAAPLLLDTISKTMKLESSAFFHEESIPSKFTCDADDTNPPLRISGVPAGTKSLVLIMDDPDAVKPAGRVWDHWIVWNIRPETSEILEGIEPDGIHGKGTGGNLEYHGPCPPDGEHRYFFKLYALDSMLDMPEGSSKHDVEQAMFEHVLDSAELVGKYKRIK